MLLQHADIAMYIAKHNQSGYALYDPSEDQYSIRRLAILNDIQTAIDKSEFELYFQPIISLVDNRVIGGEALLRWFSPVHGEVSPELLIDLAEQTALIGPLTQWVIEASLQHAKHWREQGLDIYISINLSMHNLREENLVGRIKESLAYNDLTSDMLTLEITESAMMFNPRQVIKVLGELDEMGVQLAIDDFGTGFSSLAYLKQLPVDQIKIDKSFITNLADDHNDQAIVRATLTLAQNLGLLVVVEGVEDGASWELLKSMNCHAAQGFYLSRPVPSQAFVDFVKKFSLL
jgi:EAL domain-containing protein (putative c-di-GMP-specific phosphodiesterase class I)